MVGDGGDDVDASGAGGVLEPLVMLMGMVMVVVMELNVNGDDDAECSGCDWAGDVDDGGGDGGDGGGDDGNGGCG